MSQGGVELCEGEKHDHIRSYLFPVRKWNNIYLSSSQDLSFVECLQLHMGKSGAGEVTLI